MVGDEASLLHCAERLSPALAVVDLSLERHGSVAWIARLRATCPAAKIIVIGVHDEPSVSRVVTAAGADAYVLKRDIASELVSTADALVRGADIVSIIER